MKKNRFGNILIMAAAIAATILRLLLYKGLFIKFVSGSMYDDLLQVGKAFSIANGQWLGEYGPLTIVKGAGFPILMALFHFIKVPYILGFNIIYVMGCILLVWAIYPIIKNKFILLAGYVLVLYNPIAFSTDINRYYRDIAYYAVSMVFIALIIALMVRKNYVVSLFAGFTLAICLITREDSQHLIIYAVCCMLAIIISNLFFDKNNIKKYLVQTPLFLVGLAVPLLFVAGMNYKYYGTFIIDEYNSGLYAKAYGAVTRLDGGVEETHIAIREEQRNKLYEASPAFAQLKDILDGDNSVLNEWKDVQGDYLSGYFSFSLRNAIYYAGYYRDAQSTNEYLAQLADESNAYRDSQLPLAYGKRSGIASRFYPSMLTNIVQTSLRGVKQTLKYTNVSCIPEQVEEDDTYLKIFEEFTKSKIAANRYMDNGEIVENYHLTGFELWMQRCMRVVIIIYSVMTPLLFATAIVCTVINVIDFAKRRNTSNYTFAIIQLSLFALFMTRCLMIGFVDATTFSAISNPCYQACSYTILYCFIASSRMFVFDKRINRFIK